MSQLCKVVNFFEGGGRQSETTADYTRLAYVELRLRDLCSIINRFEVEDTHLEQLQSLAQEYYRANALLLPTSVNPTIWTIGHVVPAHARQVYDKYGQGLLTVTMEGREAKHIALLKLSANTTYQH